MVPNSKKILKKIMDFQINIYEKVFIQDIKEKIEGSLVILSGLIVSLTIKEKAIIIQGGGNFIFFFMIINKKISRRLNRHN